MVRVLLVAGCLLAAGCGRFGFDDAHDAPAIDAGLGTLAQTGFLKASNAGGSDFFGTAVALSADGNTLAVGARWEDSGVGTNQLDDSASNAGAVYVFARTGSGWMQEAYLKASDPGAAAELGIDLAISDDGDTLVATAWGDTGTSGAAYVFVRASGAWSEQAKLISTDRSVGAYFGSTVGLSSDGNTLAVGAYGANSNCGGAYVFNRVGVQWAQNARFVAPNAETDDNFGDGIALSADGRVLAIAAPREDSGAVGVDGDPLDNTALGSGAVFTFLSNGSSWLPTGYLKASTARPSLQFGTDLSLSADGSRLAVGAVGADSFAGSAFVFDRAGTVWSQQAEVVAAVRDPLDELGWSIDLSARGDTLVIGARSERSAGADPLDNSVTGAGAAYVFVERTGSWAQHSYLKAPVVTQTDGFGDAVAVVGTTFVVGMPGEGNASGAAVVFDVAP